MTYDINNPGIDLEGENKQENKGYLGMVVIIPAEKEGPRIGIFCDRNKAKETLDVLTEFEVKKHRNAQRFRRYRTEIKGEELQPRIEPTFWESPENPDPKNTVVASVFYTGWLGPESIADHIIGLQKRLDRLDKAQQKE